MQIHTRRPKHKTSYEVNYLWFLMSKKVPSSPLYNCNNPFCRAPFSISQKHFLLFINSPSPYLREFCRFFPLCKRRQDCPETFIPISLYLIDRQRTDICLISLNLLKSVRSKAPREKKAKGIVQFMKN